jgi:hypothetical protein
MCNFWDNDCNAHCAIRSCKNWCIIRERIMKVKRQRTTNFWYFRAAFKAIKWIFRSCYFKYWDEQIEYKEHNRELHFPLRIKKSALSVEYVKFTAVVLYIFICKEILPKTSNECLPINIGNKNNIIIVLWSSSSNLESINVYELEVLPYFDLFVDILYGHRLLPDKLLNISRLGKWFIISIASKWTNENNHYKINLHFIKMN